ncbi:hypothetical protein [Streptomyces sp. NPDC059122]|uniref:hypothetical protein n=1 Tax=unclassified Streptomyces TaxID=2593676 RepID=UPI0036C5A006
MTSLLAVSGNPSADSRTALLAGHLVRRLSLAGFPTAHLRVRDLRTDGVTVSAMTGS